MSSVPLSELQDVAREAESLGYTDAWSSEVDGIDAFTPLALIANATSMRVGTAIVNVYTRGPQTLASSVAGMAEAAPGRFELGIGSGSQPIVERWNGMPFEKPVTKVREMAMFLREALTGEKTTFEGKTINVQGFRLSAPPKEPVPIHIAALRAGMLKVAGEVGDGAIINWLSAEDVKQSVATVRAAAKDAGRDPDAIEITARLMVNLDDVSPESDAMLRRSIAAYLNVPTYREFHKWLGRGESLGPMFEAWQSGDRKTALEVIPEEIVDELMIRGSAQERRDHVKRYMDAGVDTAFLSFATAEQDPAARRKKVMQAMREMAPSAY